MALIETDTRAMSKRKEYKNNDLLFPFFEKVVDVYIKSFKITAVTDISTQYV